MSARLHITRAWLDGDETPIATEGTERLESERGDGRDGRCCIGTRLRSESFCQALQVGTLTVDGRRRGGHAHPQRKPTRPLHSPAR